MLQVLHDQVFHDQVLHDVVTAACAAVAVIVIGPAWPDRRKTVGRRGVVTMARRTSCAYIKREKMRSEFLRGR
ncbi:MAG: hypothetical protein WBQ24_16510 [Xanthobacteraceae bacterium]|jgi:hypothetical protein